MNVSDEELQRLAMIDAICDRFEEAFQQGHTPRVEDFLLDSDEEIREQLLTELLKLQNAYAGLSSSARSVEPDSTGKWTGETDTIKSTDDAESPAVINGSAQEQIPQMIGRYQVESEIDRGSFGRVFRAYDDQLDRRVAIKVRISGTFQSQSETDDFIAEARRLAKLDHPHIVPVYDAGQLEDGSCYVVSKYIPGGNLKKTLSDQAINIAKSAKLLVVIADATDYAHRRGFVHRDLKPANILLNDDGEPYICDFGLALHEDEQLDRKGEFSGSPAYMSPEQARGESSHLDGRSDIWSLGVILYQLFTNKTPFRGATLSDLQESILRQNPKPPRMLNPEVPLELEAITLKCLEKDVRQRFQTARDISQALTEWLVAQSGAVTTREGELAGKRRPHVILLSCVVVTLVLLGGFIAGRSLLHNNFYQPIASATGNDRLLEGDLDVRIWNDNSRTRTGLSISEPGALPLQPGDQIRIEAVLSQAAYPYLVWISSDGKVLPVYPWQPDDWLSRPSNEQKIQKVSLPQTVDQAWPITGPSGMESLLLLVRNTPLPRDVDLQSMIGSLPPQSMQQDRSVVWFLNGSPLTSAEEASNMAKGENRAPQFYNPQQVNDPVLNLQARLYEQLKEHFNLIQAVAFAHAGQDKNN